MHEFRFEKLVVWQKAIDFADLIYDVTQQFPDDEKYGLSSQMKRASVSVSSNIAEGSGRISDTDLARFLEISYGSLMEVASQAYLFQRRGFVSSAGFGTNQKSGTGTVSHAQRPAPEIDWAISLLAGS